jgi:hypothetical protein
MGDSMTIIQSPPSLRLRVSARVILRPHCMESDKPQSLEAVTTQKPSHGRILTLPPHGTGWRRPRRRSEASRNGDEDIAAPNHFL